MLIVVLNKGDYYEKNFEDVVASVSHYCCVYIANGVQ